MAKIISRRGVNYENAVHDGHHFYRKEKGHFRLSHKGAGVGRLVLLYAYKCQNAGGN